MAPREQARGHRRPGARAAVVPPAVCRDCQTRPPQWEAGPANVTATAMAGATGNPRRRSTERWCGPHTTGRAVTRVRMGRPGRPGPRAGAARCRRPGRRRAGHRPFHGAAGAARLEDDPRLAVHRPPGLRPVHRRAGLRRRPAVHQPGPRPGRGTGLRFLRRLSHEPHRYARRCRRDPNRSAVHRCEGDPRAGPPCPALMRPSGAGRSSSWRTPTVSPRARATCC